MAYDEHLADRIRDDLHSKSVDFLEKKMFGGLCFMVDDKMCIGIIKENLMARIDPEKEKALLSKDGARPMDFTSRPMKGYLYVEPSAVDKADDLSFWVDQCLEFNPKANSSKKKK
jgi:TfoX/Sxy family transcriptional regulator of competence genes